MRLLRADTVELVLENVREGSKPYAILSHRWFEDEEEITLADVLGGADVKQKKGWYKLQGLREQALRDGLQHVWLDTCCIDKTSSQELTEGINSMFRWYRDAEHCYVYLHDMPDPGCATQLPRASNDTRETDSGTALVAHGIVTTVALTSDQCSEGSTHHGDAGLQILHGRSGPTADQMEQQQTNAIPQSISNVLSHTNTREEPVVSVSSATRKPTDLELSKRDMERGSVVERPDDEKLKTASRYAPDESRFPIGWNRDAFDECEWFSRGWTLQEMLAPQSPAKVRFYNKSWKFIDSLANIALDVARITKVHQEALTGVRPLSAFSTAQKMSWAAQRKTTKVEDRAYSLLGLFNVSMGIVYGEGNRAFQRLQEEILKTTADDSIFAFKANQGMTVPISGLLPRQQLAGYPLLASSPEEFGDSSTMSSSIGTLNGEYQLVGREVIFRLHAYDTPILPSRAGSPATENTDQPLFGPPRIAKMLSKRQGPLLHRKAVLRCLPEGQYATLVVLNLYSLPGMTETFFVCGDQPRIEVFENMDRKRLQSRWKRHPLKSFKVVRDPGEAAKAVVPKGVTILFQYNSSDVRSVTAYDDTPGISWDPAIKTMYAAKYPFDTSFTVLIEAKPLRAAELHLSVSSSVAGTVFDGATSIRFSGSSLHLPQWTTALPYGLLWFKPYDLAFSFGGYMSRTLVAKAYRLHGPYLERNVSLVVLDRVGHIRIGFRLVLWLARATLCLLLLIPGILYLAVFLLFPIIVFIVIPVTVQATTGDHHIDVKVMGFLGALTFVAYWLSCSCMR